MKLKNSKSSQLEFCLSISQALPKNVQVKVVYYHDLIFLPQYFEVPILSFELIDFLHLVCEAVVSFHLTFAGIFFPYADMYKWMSYGNGNPCNFRASFR